MQKMPSKALHSFFQTDALMSRLTRAFPFFACAIAFILLATAALAEDEVEFLNGSKIKGTVKEIRKEKKEFDIEIELSGRTLTRTYKFSKVHAVTLNGRRHELTPKPADNDPSQANAARSRREVEQLIRNVGSTPPDWFESTALDYPQSLDLSWPLKPPKEGWNNQVNMGQYIWDIINPNPNRWQSGIKLVQHTMSLHKGDKKLLERDMRTLGNMYFNLFQDYPRAAYWIREAGASAGARDAVTLAECYWRMGNKQMAMELFKSRTLHTTAIKLLGDMRETERALQLVRTFTSSSKFNGQQRGEVNLLAGDLCRQAGRVDAAIEFYEKALNEPEYRNQDYASRYKARARDSIEAIRLFDKANISQVADGTYSDSSIGYNGPVEVEVAVASGKIESVKVTNHQEKQFYAAITDTTRQILDKKEIANIDATSGANITSQAIANAAAKALAKGSQ